MRKMSRIRKMSIRRKISRRRKMPRRKKPGKKPEGDISKFRQQRKKGNLSIKSSWII